MLKKINLYAILLAFLFAAPVAHAQRAINNPQVNQSALTLNKGQLPGTATNDSANAGNVGEFISNTASSVAYTSGTPFNITSVSLTAGDWDVYAYFLAGNTGTQTYSNVTASISATSATQSGAQTSVFGNILGASVTLPVPYQRVTLTSTTTIFLVGTFTLSAGSPATGGGTITARRAR